MTLLTAGPLCIVFIKNSTFYYIFLFFTESILYIYVFFLALTHWISTPRLKYFYYIYWPWIYLTYSIMNKGGEIDATWIVRLREKPVFRSLCTRLTKRIPGWLGYDLDKPNANQDWLQTKKRLSWNIRAGGCRKSERITNLCEIGADEGLLHTDPDCDGDQQLLIRFLQLERRGRQELDSAQLRAVMLALLLAVSKIASQRLIFLYHMLVHHQP